MVQLGERRLATDTFQLPCPAPSYLELYYNSGDVLSINIYI